MQFAPTFSMYLLSLKITFDLASALILTSDDDDRDERKYEIARL